MRIAVMGTGAVGQALGSRLVKLGHEVTMGSRSAANEKALAWVSQFDRGASEGSFADAAATSELVINATAGMASLDALKAAGQENLAGKTILDVSNPLDFSGGMPPRLGVGDGDSVAEQLQREFPDARVVKVFNTMNCDVMADPSVLSGDHDVFLAGDHEDAKQDAIELLQSFGWPPGSIHDLGPLTSSRGLEAYVLFWITLMQAQGTTQFNIKVVR